MICVPRIYPTDLPSELMEAGASVYHNAHTLSNQPKLFRSALGLCAYANSTVQDEMRGVMTGRIDIRAVGNSPYHDWRQFSMRIGALIIYDYQQLVQSIEAIISKIPTWNAVVDRDLAKQASSLFDQTFRDVAKVRKGAAHAARITNYPANQKQNSVSGTNDNLDSRFINTSTETLNVSISGSVFDGNYTHTIDGKVVSYRLDENSATALEQITALRMLSLKPIEAINRMKS